MVVLAAASSPTSAWDQPGTIAFLIVFAMCVAMYFVFRSMSKHLRKVNEAARAEAAAWEAANPQGAGGSDADVPQSHAGNGAASGS